MTLTVYQAEVNKIVLVFSTQHKNVVVPTEGEQIPETIQYYNSTKYGMNILDRIARYFCERSEAVAPKAPPQAKAS